MRLKTLTISVLVLAIVSAAVFVARRPGPPASKDPRVGQPLVDRGAIEKAAKLRISDQGKSVTLTRQPDGTWKDSSYFDLPADFSKLSTFVSSLTDTKIDRLVTSNPDRISRLEFKDTKIDLLDGSDKPVSTLTLGKSSDSGGRFLKYDDEKKAYLANLSAWIDSDAKSWANPELLNLKPEDIARVSVEFPAVPASTTEPKSEATAATTVVFSRAKKDDPWTADKTPAGQKVKADKVASVLTSVGTLRFTDTNDLNDPAFAAAKEHERVFKLTTFDGKTYTVAMGRKPEEKKLNPPTATADGKTGPASMGSVADLAKKEGKAGEKKADDKPVAPEYETIPAGPVFVIASSSDASAPLNALMQKRAFQIGDYIFTGLPQKADEMFEPAPPPAPSPEAKKADVKPAAAAETKSPPPPATK